MRGLERVTNPRHDGKRLRRGEAAGPHRLAEVYAIHLLDQPIAKAAALTVLENGDEVRVVQFGQHPRLAGETPVVFLE